jgi:hydroxymethylbilane synthase
MRIGTRGSSLALWQARTVARLVEETGGPACEIVVIRTSGDERQGPPEPPVTTGPLNVKATFVKEIEDALLRGDIDAAVHSSKDLPADLPDGLRLGAALERADPRDALVLPGDTAAGDLSTAIAWLGPAPRLGTSSVRRAAQLRTIFPHATFLAIRGNVDTRLRKLDAGDCDAIVLAAAGLVRLGLASRMSAMLPLDVCLPAPGQGIVAVEIATECSSRVRRAVAAIDDMDAAVCLLAERAVVKALGGGCQMPLGALAVTDGQHIDMRGLVASVDGQTIVRASTRGNRGNAAAVGEKLGALLLARDAARILGGT